MAGWIKVREHIWPDEHGEPVLRHTKYLTREGEARFPWEHRMFWPETGLSRWFDGDGKDDGIVHPLLYRRDVFAQADRAEHAFAVEGEKDADALTSVGVLAVTAGGVGMFRREHARLFKGWRGQITIIRDRDAAGAWGAARTYDALRDVGIRASRLRVARGRCKAEGSDTHDHLAAGYSVAQFVSEPIAKVRRLADSATSADFARAGYSRKPRHAEDPGWVVVGADEVAQLPDWKPIRS
jgi:hypothetical protein